MLLGVGIVVEGARRSLPGLERESHMVAEEGILVEARHMAAVVGDIRLVEEDIVVVGEHHIVVAEGNYLAEVGIVLVGVGRMAAEEDSRPVEEEGQHILPAEKRRTAVEVGEHRMAGMEVAENLFSCQFCHVQLGIANLRPCGGAPYGG
jgi:hypothetical protein